MIILETISNCTFYLYCLIYKSIHNINSLLILKVKDLKVFLLYQRWLCVSAQKGLCILQHAFLGTIIIGTMDGEPKVYMWQSECRTQNVCFIAFILLLLAPLTQLAFNLPLPSLHSVFTDHTVLCYGHGQKHRLQIRVVRVSRHSETILANKPNRGSLRGNTH